MSDGWEVRSYATITSLRSTSAKCVHIPNSTAYLNGTPIFEWYVVRSGSKNGNQKYTCVKMRLDCMLTIWQPIRTCYST
jgi:hypothetical protein